MDKSTIKFISRLIIGLLIALGVGNILDEKLSISPFITLLLIVYVVGGSLYILVKDNKNE